MSFLLMHFDGHVRVPVFQALQMMRQKVADDRVAGGQAQYAAGTDIGQRTVQRIIDAAQNDVSPVEKMTACFSQAHALRRALKQQGAEHALQFLDRRGDRRLGNVQVNGRLRDLPDLGSCHEITDLAQGQGHKHSRQTFHWAGYLFFRRWRIC